MNRTEYLAEARRSLREYTKEIQRFQQDVESVGRVVDEDGQKSYPIQLLGKVDEAMFNCNMAEWYKAIIKRVSAADNATFLAHLGDLAVHARQKLVRVWYRSKSTSAVTNLMDDMRLMAAQAVYENLHEVLVYRVSREAVDAAYAAYAAREEQHKSEGKPTKLRHLGWET